jgi:hypothetical protein
MPGGNADRYRPQTGLLEILSKETPSESQKKEDKNQVENMTFIFFHREARARE